MVLANYHTHTKFCDGVEMPIVYVEEAIKQNLKALGFSAHAPVPFSSTWNLPKEKYSEYKSAILQLQHEFKSKLEISCGLEIDYIPELWPEMKAYIEPSRLDYFLGSIHFIDTFDDGTRWTIDGSNEEFRKGWEGIFMKDSHAVIRKFFGYSRDMVEQMKPPVIGHLDKIKMQYTATCFVSENDPVYRLELIKTLEAIRAAGSIVEVNTRGMYRRKEEGLYPGLWALQQMAKMDIPVVISSDAHRPSELINLFDFAASQLVKAGYKKTVYFTQGEWVSVEL